jgi:hypothetical protein
MRLLGIAREDASAEDDPSLDLKGFLAEARRASAEILSASPTDFSFEAMAGDKRRIWELALRVLPVDESAFEATAEVAWRLTHGIEERLDRGEFLTCVPAEKRVIDVAFDPGNRDQVIAFGDDDGPPLAFRTMIVGGSSGPGDDDAPTQPRPSGRDE